MRFARLFILWLTCAALTGCDRDSGNAGTSPQPSPPPQRSLGVQITSITPLPPGRRTHVAPDGQGRLFWVQEGERGGGNEVVFVMSDGMLPQATKLTTASILEALGQAGAGGAINAKAAWGSFHSLTVGPDGRLYFYFSGGRGKVALAALGALDPKTTELQILADATKLERVAGIGGLPVARGTLLRSGDVLWLWLRHTDGYALLTLDTAKSAAGELRKPFERVIPALSQPPNLTVIREDLTAAASGSALLFWERYDSGEVSDDAPKRGGRIWKIERTGAASVLKVLAELPSQTLPPAIDDAGQLVFLAPSAANPAPALSPTATPATQYPVLVVVGDDKTQVLDKDRFEAPARVKLNDFLPQRLWRDRSAFVTYDTITGELLRLKVVER